jgi:hypothetical protein
MTDGVSTTTDWQKNSIIKDQGLQRVHQSLFSDRKSRPRIGEGMAVQRKWQEKEQEPNLRDLLTNPQEGIDLLSATTMGAE